MKALSILSSLSAAEKNFLKSKQIIAGHQPDEWLYMFKKLKAFDCQGEGMRRMGFSLGCLGSILTVVGFFLLVAYAGALMIPLGVLLGVGGFAVYFYLKSYDIPGEVLNGAVIPMILILREEMKPGQNLKLRLDLRGFSMPEKLVSQSPSYARGAYHAIIDSYYRDRWLDGETELADGTRLIWTIEDLVKSSRKSKRNARGKHKSKTKTSHRTFISMQIGMNNKKYSLPEKVKEKGAAEGSIKTKDAGQHSWMSVKKTVKHSTGQTFAPTDFVNAVASAYARAIPASAGRERRG